MSFKRHRHHIVQADAYSLNNLRLGKIRVRDRVRVRVRVRARVMLWTG